MTICNPYVDSTWIAPDEPDEPDPMQSALADMMRDPATIGGYIDDSGPMLLQSLLDIIYHDYHRSEVERVAAMRQAVNWYRHRAADEYAGRVRRMAR